jgi:membrane-bound serine protease (ClpP class)
VIVAAIVLLVVALAFVAAELFIPSHGILSICAVGAALASVVMAFRASPALGMLFALAIMVATPVVVYLAIKIYPNTAVGKRVMLDAGGGAGGPVADAFAREGARLAELVGQQGVAVTMLRPAGSIEIGGRRVDALSEAEVIDAGTRVEVVRVAGLKVFVKAVV